MIASSTSAHKPLLPLLVAALCLVAAYAMGSPVEAQGASAAEPTCPAPEAR